MKYLRKYFIFIFINMQEIILPLFYFPPISWFSEYFKAEDKVILEQLENFPKQTFRNRTNIYGANGKLSLIIPICNTESKLMKDIEISYKENWQKNHWKSIESSYKRSPYFEYYEDKFQALYNKEEKYLLDFNLKCLEVIKKILKIEKAQSLNEEFVKNPLGTDFRTQFSAKKDSLYEIEEYYQTFSDKLGFMKDLSIIDLICNKGPESTTYIKNIKN